MKHLLSAAWGDRPWVREFRGAGTCGLRCGWFRIVGRIETAAFGGWLLSHLVRVASSELVDRAPASPWQLQRGRLTGDVDPLVASVWPCVVLD